MIKRFFGINLDLILNIDNKNIESAEQPFSYFQNGIKSFELKEYHLSIESFLGFIRVSQENEAKLLGHTICGFIYLKSSKYLSSIREFNEAIRLQGKCKSISNIFRCLSYAGRSESKYKSSDFKGAIDDKLKSIEFTYLEESILNKSMINSINTISFSSQLLHTTQVENINTFVKEISNINSSRYDLIRDFVKVIDDKRKEKIRHSLEARSLEKYRLGDYKAAIVALRRADKYI